MGKTIILTCYGRSKNSNKVCGLDKDIIGLRYS